MARVKFEVQGRRVYQTTLTVRVNDVNYGGHLGNDAVLTLCHEARVRFLRSGGHSELDFYGRGIIMTDAMVIYRSEGSLGDAIEITLYIDDIGKHGFDFYYALMSREKEIARVKTGIAFFDYQEHKISACPAEFLRAYQ